MGRPGIQMWTWTLCVFLKWLSVDQVLGEPQYMVAIPAVLEAGSETKFCASLLQPSRSVVMTVTLVSEEKSTTLLKHTSSEEFHMCTQFKVPLVQNNEVQTFQVEVRSSIFYSKQVRKVMIKVYQPLTFVQTDKPLYLPGQTGNLNCISVTVTPAPSLHYTLTPLSGDQYTSCLCENERKTFRWTMVPSALGTVNVTAEAVASHLSCDNEIVRVLDRGRNHKVTKSLIVKAEGTEITKAYNWLLCPKGEALTEEINIQLPENVIDGSARASVSVLGDILGRALQDLDGLLHIPYGSGEQNMALLAPSIYILQYLKNTQQLTPIISEKAANFLTSGYHRQLNYKHNDGAYSTFESGPGNTWLTAFVLRSFTKAQTFIYIDPTKIEESKAWLKNKQRENGCFEQSGKLFNNRMKGGVSDEVTLTAYITALCIITDNLTIPVMTKSLLCIKESISDLSNTYTTALLAYVFTLAGDMETRAHLLQHLDTVASKQGGSLHWSQTARQTLAPLSVEISSYVLLAKLSTSPTNEDLIYSSRIVRWLTGQQNYYGGFSSTQDTVVALQALALYSTLMFSPEGSSMVTVQSPSGQLTFDVNQENKLLYQEKTLQDTTGKYSLEVKGTACASVQISLHYNIPTLPDVNTLSVEVKPEANCSESLKPSLTLKFSGTENSTNMVILDIKLLSGFKETTGLKHALFVKRVDEKKDHVLVYIKQVRGRYSREQTKKLSRLYLMLSACV
uniref:Alpha-macroglobulin receptor-binding domain-containing protein n=1 Tax=Anabas testudineus TaxID=64144 RepID=A0A3Q1J895_ANATE